MCRFLHTRSVPTQHIQWYFWQGNLWYILIETFLMILGSSSIWRLAVILHNMDRTIYSWRLSGSMTLSTMYQVLAGGMRILRRDQSENWIRYGTTLCTRTKLRSGYGIMDWYVSGILETYLHLSNVIQVIERLLNISQEIRRASVNISSLRLWLGYLSWKFWIRRTIARTVARCVQKRWSGYIILGPASLRHCNFMHHCK